MYVWVDEIVATTDLNFIIEASLRDIDITISDPSEWLVLPGPEEKRTCNTFDDCMALFYECLFMRIGPRIPFFEFELSVLKHLKFPLPNFIWGHGHI